MNFEKKYFTRSSLTVAALMLAGCVVETRTPAFAVPAETESVTEITEVTADGVTDLSEKEVSATEISTATVPVVPEKLMPADPASLSIEEIEAEMKALSEATGKLHLEKTLIESRLGLAMSETESAMQALSLEKMLLDADRAERMAKIAEEIAEVEEERTELERRLALENARANAAFRQKQKELSLLELVLREQQMKLNSTNMNTQYAVAMADKQAQLSTLAPTATATKYLKEPFVDGTLYISDRRVALNGPVTSELAKTVCDQLYFFNNKSEEYPIFIVIDNSPGGSVAAGYQIQKAMQSCKAPVYVVVKSMAASMAAVIATTAERSFCFPNTRILHHQISSGVKGNLTVMREGVETGALWYKRFGEPVAKKMGLTLDEFTKQMYAHNSDGDWMEPGYRAVELKWVDHVVDRIEETGLISVAGKTPDRAMPQAPQGMKEEVDAQGRRFVELPVLENPFDFWAIYDKNNYYRAR